VTIVSSMHSTLQSLKFPLNTLSLSDRILPAMEDVPPEVKEALSRYADYNPLREPALSILASYHPIYGTDIAVLDRALSMTRRFVELSNNTDVFAPRAVHDWYSSPGWMELSVAIIPLLDVIASEHPDLIPVWYVPPPSTTEQ
jgi:hypothetical protein